MFDEKQAELAKLNRDLRFKPANPDKARTLTAEQVAFYNTNGYLKPFRIFDESQTRANRAYFDFLTAEIEAADDGRNAYSINGYQNTCRGLWDLTMTAGILDLVADIGGPDIVSWGCHFFCKLAGDPKRVSWHQDAAYCPLTPWGQKTRTSHLLLYSQQLQAGIEGNLGRRQSPQISPSQDRFPTIGASAQLTHGGIS